MCAHYTKSATLLSPTTHYLPLPLLAGINKFHLTDTTPPSHYHPPPPTCVCRHSAGINKFYLTDTGSKPPMQGVLEDYIASGLVEYTFDTKVRAQRSYACLRTPSHHAPCLWRVVYPAAQAQL